jgi:hypothetical protein
MRSDVVNDPYLGQLFWQAKRRWWEGASNMIDGTPFTLYVNPRAYEPQVPPFDNATCDRAITQQAQEALARVRQSHSQLRAAVAKKYWSLYTNWNDGESITNADFMRRLILESVAIMPDGGAEVFFQDDGMFGGHALIAHLDPDGVVRYVEMFG